MTLHYIHYADQRALLHEILPHLWREVGVEGTNWPTERIETWVIEYNPPPVLGLASMEQVDAADVCDVREPTLCDKRTGDCWWWWADEPVMFSTTPFQRYHLEALVRDAVESVRSMWRVA